MNFTPPTAPPPDWKLPPAVSIGNVYKSKGGKGTAFWVIVNVRGQYAHALGLDAEGEIVTTTSYGLHTFEGRELLGRCEDLKGLTLKIDWEDGI